MTLKEAERKLWTDAYQNAKVKYIDIDSLGYLKDLTTAVNDDYYTKGSIDSIINNIMKQYDEGNKQTAKTFIEDHIDLLEDNIDDFLEKCPSAIIDNVCKILEDAEIITEDNVREYIRRKTVRQLNDLSNTIKADYMMSKSQYSSAIDTSINFYWWETAKWSAGTFDD